MLEKAPEEKDVYPALMNFLEEAIKGKVVLRIYNMNAIMFLSGLHRSLGYNAELYYVDALEIACALLKDKGLKDNSQETIGKYFHLQKRKSYRTLTNARICGGVLANLLENMDEQVKEEDEKERLFQLKCRPTDDELEVCAFIYNIIASRNGSTDLLGFYKSSHDHVDVYYFYEFLQFKLAKKGRYIVLPHDIKGTDAFIKEPCPKYEGGSRNIRVYFQSPDLEMFSDYILEQYQA